MGASIQARNTLRQQQQAAAAGMPQGYIQPAVFYGPGQSFLPPGAQRGMPFAGQPGMVIPGMQGGQGAGRMPPQGRGQMMPNREEVAAPSTLSNLASLPPSQQKQMLGEAIYPKIQQMQPELAGKITGMLLEMDNSELLSLVDDDAALRSKVDEALSVYDDYMKSRGGEAGPNGTKGEDASKAEGPEATA